MTNKILRTPEERTKAMMNLLSEKEKEEYHQLSLDDPEAFERRIRFILTP